MTSARRGYGDQTLALCRSSTGTSAIYLKGERKIKQKRGLSDLWSCVVSDISWGYINIKRDVVFVI